MPISGGPGQQATPNPIRAMPSEAAHDNADTGDFCVKQQPDDERGNN